MKRTRRPDAKHHTRWENLESTKKAKAKLEEILQKIKPDELNKKHFVTAWSEPSFKNAIVDAQDKQCVWCTVMPEEGGDKGGAIDHIRPKTMTFRYFIFDAKGERHAQPKGGFRPGYYWRAYDPLNFAFSCRRCSNAKGSIWPLRGWKDESSWTAPDQKASERELFLDPFVDTFNPFDHFQFDSLGTLVARPGDDGAEATVATVGLDCEFLCGKRRKIYERITSDVTEIKRFGTPAAAATAKAWLLNTLATDCSWQSSHAAYYRAALKHALHSAGLSWSFLRAAWDELGIAADITEPPDDAWIV